MLHHTSSRMCDQRGGTYRLITFPFLVLLALFMPNHAAAQAAPNHTADQITFINGDKLTGTVLSESSGIVVFQSDMAGATISVPWSRIKQLHSSNRFAVIERNQMLRVGKAAPQVPIGTVSYSNNEISVVPSRGETRSIPAKDAAYLVGASDFEEAIGHE